MPIRILNPGILTTLQDKGRYGYRNYAVPVSGALDLKSFEILHDVLGQSPTYPCFEVFGFEAAFEFTDQVQFGISGAANRLYIDDEMVDPSQIYKAEQGTRIRFEVRDNGGWITYLGITGKLVSDLVLDSFSTNILSGIGGFGGKPLKKGDEVSFVDCYDVTDHGILASQNYYRTATIRFTPGPEYDFLSSDQKGKWISSPWRVSPESNRMGYRLTGEPLAPQKLLSDSRVVIPGTIQLPSSGMPIVIMKDGQTTGGYPRVAQIIEEDLDQMAQCAPGTIVRFKEIGSRAE